MGTRHIARRVLHFRGIWATFFREYDGTFDPETSSVSGEQTTEVRAKGKLSNFTVEEVNGVEIQRDDRRFLVPSMDFDGPTKFLPRKGDTVIFDKDVTIKFHVHNVRSLDTDKALLIQLRGGGPSSPAAGSQGNV